METYRTGPAAAGAIERRATRPITMQPCSRHIVVLVHIYMPGGILLISIVDSRARIVLYSIYF